MGLTVLLTLAASCSQRQRLNPFDPANPATGGRPIGFQSRAADGYVLLDWSGTPTSDLLGYRLYRRFDGETDFQVLADLIPSRVRNYNDFGLTNGVRVTYRLYYVFEAGVSTLSAEDYATPGTLTPWIADFDAGNVQALTPDGRHILRTLTGFESPAGIVVDPADGWLWVTDPFAGEVTKLDPLGSTRRRDVSLSRPSGIALDRTNGSVWVTDELEPDVTHFASGGGLGSPSIIGPVTLATGIAVDPRDQSVWVCVNGTAQLKLFAADGSLRWTLPMQRPSRVAVDSTTGDAWVTSFESGVAVRLSRAGVPLDTLRGFSGPIGVAVDPQRGRIWIADAFAGSLRCFDRAGVQQVRLDRLDEVREVAVDPATGNAWATVRGRGEVVVVAPSGAIVGRVGGMVGPYGIALDPGGRRAL